MADTAAPPNANPAASEPKGPSATAPGPDPAVLAAAMMTPEQLGQIEKLSTNLARAAMTAQGALTSAALRGGQGAMDADPLHVGPAMTEVLGQLAQHPERLVEAQADLLSRYMDLWQSAARRAMTGGDAAPAVVPAKGDKRFNDPAWSENPVFDVMKQSYLLTSEWMNRLVGSVEGVEPLTKRRVEFFTKMMTDSLSPSNFLASNPAALKATLESGGENLVRGMANFAADLERGGGALAISMTDQARFKVGENVATAPGKVVYRNQILELLQFEPTAEEVHSVPLLIFPPWINKWYILDLRPENSMIRWLTSQGFTVFVASWVNPDSTLAAKTFADYMHEGIYDAVAQVKRQCDVETVNTVGYCIGGTLLSCTLAHMAKKGDTSIASATFFAAQQDFSEAGDLLIFVDDNWLSSIEKQMDEHGGVLPGKSMADTFNSLRANDLIWSFYVNNYLLGKDPAAFDLLFWNADQTRMPKTLHLFYLREFYKDNKLAKGELELDGVRLNLADVKTPVFVQSSKDDHIAPLRSVYRGSRLFGGPVTFMMAGSGHIAGVINHPAAKKYQHWVSDARPESVQDWVASAEEHPGSWWPKWGDWLRERSGEMVPARDPSAGPLAVLGDAPGEFVRIMS
jgi:polyhydroxyalkanoate synthase